MNDISCIFSDLAWKVVLKLPLGAWIGLWFYFHFHVSIIFIYSFNFSHTRGEWRLKRLDTQHSVNLFHLVHYPWPYTKSPNLSSLVAVDVVMTIYGAAFDDKVGIINTLNFQCKPYRLTTYLEFDLGAPGYCLNMKWIGSALVQIMACRLFSAKPLPEPVLGYHQLGPYKETWVKF